MGNRKIDTENRNKKITTKSPIYRNWKVLDESQVWRGEVSFARLELVYKVIV